MTEPDAITLEGVGKRFRHGFWMKQVEAVQDVSLTVPNGSLFGYLGHNGAGKTTTIKMLLGLIRPTRGRVQIWGQNPSGAQVRQRVGYLPEQPYFYDYLTTTEFLNFHADLCGIAKPEQGKRIAELLDQVGLTGVDRVQLNKFSKGMLQRIGLAQALIGDPDLVVLDEPMSGLDPAGRKRVRDIMVMLKERGKTVFFSTHILSDAEAVCDQVAILVKGQVRSTGRISELLSPQVTEVEIITRGLPEGFTIPGAKTDPTDGGLCFRMSEVESGPALSKIVAGGGQVVSVTPHKETLEELFMSELSGVERVG